MQTYYRNTSYQIDRRLPVVRRRKRLKLYLVITLGIVCIVGIALITKNLFNNGQSEGYVAAASDSNEPAPASPEPPKRQIDTSTLQASLSQITKKYPYNTSVSVIDLNSGTLVQTGDSYPFIAASTTKLLTSIFYLSKVEAKETALGTNIGGKTAEEQLRLAIKNSDNTAWAQLNNYLGKGDLSNFAKAHGITSYDSEKNTITSNDMAGVMAKLYQRKLINEEHTKLLLSWMQETSEERFIPAAVPEGNALYHKAGYLADRVHDVAIIDNGSAPFILVIYSKSYTQSYDYLIGQKLFKQITQQTITTFK